MTDTIEYHNTLPIGYRLQDYEIQAIIGVGGFGITYLAKDMHLNHKVAIKEYFPNDLAVRDNTHSVQPKSQQDSQGFAWGLERFIQEARTLAQFKHLNIVRVLRFFEGHNTGYIVMEYERGQSLEEALKGGETATEEELMTILPPLLDALGTLHNANFLHRDIKPSNIYLRDKDNSPVLIDFGAARYDVSSRSRSVTSIVTPGYAPFEQYESDGSRQGAWTDIYALGAVLYRTIGGERPTEATKRIGDTMRGRPDPLKPAVEVGRGHYSERLLQGIDSALQVLEKDRPQTVAAWAEVLLGKSSNSSKQTKWERQKIGDKATKTAPTQQQPASLDKRGETAHEGFINKVFFADKSVIRVINWRTVV
jgi:serine/threonine protein kinase